MLFAKVTSRELTFLPYPVESISWNQPVTVGFRVGWRLEKARDQGKMRESDKSDGSLERDRNSLVAQ